MVTRYIKNHISKAPQNAIFFSRDFINFGHRGAVDVCLMRLVRDGFITRIGTGIYVRYDCTKDFTATEIAQSKAKRFNRTAAVPSTQTEDTVGFQRASNETIFISEGSRTSFLTIKGRISFRPTNARLTALNNLKTGGKIAALWRLKEDKASEEQVLKILSSLSRTEKEELLWAHDLMPGWLSDLVHKSCGGKLHFPLKGK